MKSTVALAAALALTPLLSGCVILDGFQPGPATTTVVVLGDDAVAMTDPSVVLPGHVEPIHAAAIGQDQAVFWVSSNGCTQKADLAPVVRRAAEGSVITLRRIKEDRCGDARPQGVEVRWSFQELGLESGARLSVENPYQMPQT
jgi:hypothetical protein